ncbi:MAG: DNA-directed RNA polymerase subunit omega [bacterium]|nr:DNA-directed RNA polymerase subunit omega [bacterium]MCY3924327.1 DNA-directed RNA polymerase subunit omega [bacterium]
MINPPVEELLERADDSKFRLVSLGATRARQINSYYGQLGEGLGRMIPPQVSSTARKPLSIALQEIEQGKIVAVTVQDPPESEDDEPTLELAGAPPEQAG